MVFINYDSYAHFSEVHYMQRNRSYVIFFGMRVKNAAYKIT